MRHEPPYNVLCAKSLELNKAERQPLYSCLGFKAKRLIGETSTSRCHGWTPTGLGPSWYEKLTDERLEEPSAAMLAGASEVIYHGDWMRSYPTWGLAKHSPHNWMYSSALSSPYAFVSRLTIS